MYVGSLVFEHELNELNELNKRNYEEEYYSTLHRQGVAKQ